MRVKSLEIEGFRGFPGEAAFDLAADAVIVAGANGQGKTSFFDAIMWGITGAIPRLGEEASNVVSLYAESGRTRVRIVLTPSEGDEIDITRSVSAGEARTAVQVGNKKRQGEAAVAFLMENVWPEALLTQHNKQALVSAITNSVYLQQDLVRDFVEAQDEKERFAAVGELVGAGRVTELQLELEKQKKAWARATTDLSKEREALEERRQLIEAELMKLSSAPSEASDVLETLWTEWWRDLRRLQAPEQGPPAFGGSDAPGALDKAVRELQMFRYRLEQRRGQASSLLDQMGKYEWGQETPGETAVAHALEQTREKLGDARIRLKAAQAQAAEVRKQLVEAREASEELRAMSELALRHLGEVCPVCGQSYDHEHTARRLKERIETTASDPEATPEKMLDVGALANEVEALEKREANEERAHKAARERKLLLEEMRALDLAVENGEKGPRVSVRRHRDGMQQESERASDLLRRAEALALRLTRASEEARRTELEKELSTLTRALEERKAEAAARERTANLSAQILDAFRKAASEVVELKLQEVEPLLQRIYSTIDPHPSFRTVRLLTRIAYGRGRLSTAIHDPRHDAQTEHPDRVLSSSQLNALAVSIFLALNLGIPKPPLEAAILDDPLQSLDEVNLLGLIDLLRRTKNRRQLFISTHDDRFASLLEKKLRPVLPSEQTRVLRFTGWGRRGPNIEVYDIELQTDTLKLVAK